MNNRPIILAFNKFYLPGYKAGGPIRSLANITDRLGDELDFRVVTLDRDAGDSLPYPKIRPCSWTVQGHANVYYFPPDQLSVFSLARLVREIRPDVLYLNSFFDPMFTQSILCALRLRLIPRHPTIIAPRGEFSAGALELKAIRKRLYLAFAKRLGIYNGLVWQASSILEKTDIQRVLPFVRDANVRIASDLAPTSELGSQRRVRKSSESLRICFLSRISPKKNLDYALQVLSRVRANVTFSIYGPKEIPEYWQMCESLMAELPANIQVSWAGELRPEEVHDELIKHELFFFPTRGENYGHVIHEALMAGLPVLISDQTPWGAVAEHGVGWALPLDNIEKFSLLIDEIAAWDPALHRKIHNEATTFARSVATDNTTLNDNRSLFQSVISPGI